MDYIISPSVMCMDLMNLGEQIKTLNKHVSMYHVDFIDGVYLKNFSTIYRSHAQDYRRRSRYTCNVNGSILLSG